MNELNKQLLEAIESDVCWERHEFESDDFCSEIAANECEKICLQAQIDLINRISENSYDGEIGYTLHTYKAELQEQLKQLNQ